MMSEDLEKKGNRSLWRILYGVFFILAGSNHFFHAASYVKIMPSYLPWPAELVAVSGFFEIALGLLLCIPATSRWAAWGLIALLIAVFPANIQMALHPNLYPAFNPVFLWLRLPLQGVLILLAYACAS